MTNDNAASGAPTREVVGLYSRRDQLETAVAALVAAGFDRTDLSVLASHDSLAVAGGAERSWRDLLVALLGDIKYEGPLVAAGLIALAAGPMGAVVAGLVAAGVGGVAAKEVFDEIASRPHSADFARALAAGSVILWVAVADDDRERIAGQVLARTGATNVHTHERGRRPA